MEEIIIFGASGHAKVITDIFERLDGYEIVGFMDTNKEKGTNFLGYPILGDENVVSDLLKVNALPKFFVAIGDNWSRKLVVNRLKRRFTDIRFVNAIHPSAIIAKNVVFGEGVAIIAGTVINRGCRIDDFTILNTKCSVGHDCHMKQFSSIAPNVTLGGNVQIGETSSVSISATVLNGKKIGDNTIIGAASLLTTDAESNAVYYGVPGKFIKNREPNEKYL
ncbi:acetyltransferase [Flagellimonas hymeniacidonis]|uniref:Acetyltransferase n=1 Tax=Flagellimonas hymeniacidonis TaxID=2603628 RepID=A0A5C8V4L1_9FLAO|nr:acetyltransferase [Flagellimonas hymeniacidonis]TXN35955.1 acetyltransferase [Flagellimonas hymeniacidonis]